MKDLKVGDKVWMGCYTSIGASSEGESTIEEVEYRYHEKTGVKYKVYKVGSHWFNQTGGCISESSMFYIEEMHAPSDPIPKKRIIDADTAKIYANFDMTAVKDILSDMSEEFKPKNKVMHTGYLTRDIDGVWMVKWSDLHSFAHGTHWCYTYLSDDSNVIKSIEDDKVIFKPLKEETQVKFEMVISGYDEKTYTPNQKAKLVFPEVDAYEKEEIIKTYVRDGGELFLITKIDRIRDGGTMVIVTNSKQPDNKKFYVHKDYWTLHDAYPLTDENIISNDYRIKYYIVSKLERYKEHLNTELNQVSSIIEKLK